MSEGMFRTRQKITRRKFIGLAAAGAGATLLGACGGAGGQGGDGEQFTLRAGHQLAVDTPFDKGLKRFAKLAEEKTNGQVKVQVFPNAEIGDEPELFQGMQEGTADVAVLSPGSAGEFVPEMNMLILPFLVTSREQRNKIINGEPAKAVEQLVEEKTDVHTMGYFGGGIRSMLFTEPAASMEDVQGRIFRVQPTKILTDIFKAVGLSPTVVAYTELYNALQQGVVEGAENEPVFILSQKFYEVAPHMLLTQHEVTIRPLMISGATLDRLPENLRNAVLEAGAEASEYEREVEAEADDQSLQTLQEEHGVAVKDVDLLPLIEAVEPIWQRAAEQWGLEDVLQQMKEARSAAIT